MPRVGLGGANAIPYEEFKANQKKGADELAALGASDKAASLSQANLLNSRLSQADSINSGLNQGAQTSQQPGFNVNQAAAGSLQGAIGATEQALQGH